MKYRFKLLALLFCIANLASGQKHILDRTMHHLRIGNQPEWDEFAKIPVEKELLIHFKALENKTEQALCLRQYDVKQVWRILLNGSIIDSLIVDGNDMRTYFKIPPATLINGENILSIQAAGKITDDIMVGEFILDDRSLEKVLSEVSIDFEVVDGKS